MSEDALHRAVAQYLALVLKPPTIWTTIGHGGGGRVRGAQLKAKGVKAGWPDILVMKPDGPRGSFGTVVVGIELKAQHGRLSDQQRDMLSKFWGVGAFYAICREIDDVKAILKEAEIL